MSTVITVEKLGKKYTLHHQQREQYTALRDVLTNSFRNFSKKIFSPLASRSSPISASQEDFWALKDVSFEVKQGDRIGIIGRNGAGKSTLLKILSRITEPTTGYVRIRGRVASLLEVGTGFHPELTGRENIFLNGAILGMSRLEIKKKFDEIVDFAEIEKFLDTPVKRYSSGMYVRLAFAVAAHLEPEILIVDEVLAVGDAQFQKKCLGKMEDISFQGGKTIIFVSHNIPTIQTLCCKAGLLQGGQLADFGDVADVVTSYLLSVPARLYAKVDLSDAPRSAGRTKVIQKGWLETPEGDVVTSFLMGAPAVICFSYTLDDRCTTANFGFGIDSLEGLRIFSASSSVNGGYSDNIPLHGVARCFISEMPLVPGTYVISLSVVEYQTEWVDFIERALSFEVLPSDIFGTGKILGRTHGIVFTRCNIDFTDTTV